jgi:hypothetical protein
MENWADNVLKDMEQRLLGTREKDLRFFRIDELRRNIRRVDEFAHKCDTCRHLKVESESALIHVNEAVNVPGSHRRELDRVVARLSRHMMKVHKFYPPWYFNYLYSFYGIAVGSLAGFLLVIAIPSRPWELMAAGFVTGIIVGQLLGGSKDRKIRGDERLM